jgi:methyltransferase (TIGR00027 family)
MEQLRIEKVSDTALWVAQCRAAESFRSNALFKDALAQVLAGERGRKLAQSMPYAEITQWLMAVRTVAIDRLILDALPQGADVVLNLGAGMDTRPYRLDLPSALTWIEVDLENIIELKNQMLARERPRCQLERVVLDLSQRSTRLEYFARVSRRASKILVVTEGVIPYLSNDEVSALAEDLFATPTCDGWIHDFRNGGYARSSPASFNRRLSAAPFRFDTDNWFGFFEKHGWMPERVIKTMDESKRVGRPMPIPFPWDCVMRLLPSSISTKLSTRLFDGSGYVLMKRDHKPRAG